jgi:D-alanine-D-alanine ligase
VPVVEGVFVQTTDDLRSVAAEFPFPAFVKPNYEGSSKGITARSLCRDATEFIEYGAESLKLFPAGLLVERFIPGRDVAVPYIAGLGDEGVLEPLEYVLPDDASGAIYDYDLKNHRNEAVTVRCPALLDKRIRDRIVAMMKRIVPALGVADFGRADFRVTPEGDVFFLEMNALPSLQPGAGMFESTKLLGLDYDQTIQKIVEAARARLRLNAGGKLPRRWRSSRQPQVALVYNLKRKAPTDPEFEHEAEFDSQRTIDAITEAIRKLGVPVIGIEATKNLAEHLQDAKIDVVFNIAEGSNKRAREAQVPAICDLLGIEHTGSDATCLALTLDKALTKRLVANDGIRTPAFRLYQGGKVVENGLRYPVIVKPNHEGTSKGISAASVVRNHAELTAAVQEQWQRYREPILCEEYIEGREFTVGVLGTSSLKLLGPMEIAFTPSAGPHPVYGFEAKHVDPTHNSLFELKCPVSLGKEQDRRIASFARKAFRSVGCRDVARMDFRMDAQGTLYFIEINPLPGLSPGFSDLVVAAERSGVTYDALIKRILMPAIQRWRTAGRLTFR